MILNERMKMMLAFAAIYLIWGSTYLAIRWGVETVPPWLMMGSRTALGGMILILLSRPGKRSHLRKEHLPGLFIIGIAFFVMGHGAVAWSEQHVPSGLVAILIASEPLWIMLFESAILRDTRLSRSGIVGLVLGFVAIVLLVFFTETVSTSDVSILPALVVLAGTIIWAGGAVYARKARLPKSAMLTAGMEQLIGGSLLVLAGGATGEFSALDISAVSLTSALSMVYLMVFGSVIAFSAYMWLLGHTSASRVSTHTYVNPIIAIFVGWAIGGEVITWPILAASGVIILSVYLTLRTPVPQPPTGREEDGKRIEIGE